MIERATASAPTGAEDLPLCRLDTVLLQLMRSRRVAALATLSETGEPALSLVPFAVDASGRRLLIFVSGLAAHTQQLRQRARASVLVHEPEDGVDQVHALSRVAIDVEARILDATDAEAYHASLIYLSRFPAARMLAELPDFVWVALTPISARQVAGFGAARSIEGDRFRELLNSV